jgi:L,D-transpeptidase catalytic domain
MARTRRAKPRGTKRPAAKATAKPAPKRKPAKGTKQPTEAARARATLARRIAAAKALEALDAAGATRPTRSPAGRARAAARAANPLRNPDFPRTYIREIAVSLDDPDHWMTLRWTGPQASSQQSGPYRTSPGAGVTGLNCDLTATSQRSGTKCTPKGTHYVEGFASRLTSDARATNVTWFVRRRGIALHYFPSVPRYAASHGCVRIESKRIAQVIQDNARVAVTRVAIGGKWTKPARQW